MTQVYCICGHFKGTHHPKYLQKYYSDLLPYSPTDYVVDACYFMDVEDDICSCEKFTQDNLKLVEHIAKKRKLV